MKPNLLIPATLLFVVCGGTERPLSAVCQPAVNVTVPAAPKTSPKPKTAAAPERQHEVVQVYWDVSRSMREFAAARRARGGAASETDDLTPVVDALDSSVLLSAHAERVEQYGVGESIRPLSSARAALHPTAGSTVLHLAAEQIGTALASGTAQAAVVVSDLELDTPPRTASRSTVCGGVPLPSTPEAGSLFGRCFENAAIAEAAPLTRTHLLAHVFRKSSHGRELFILLLATDAAFGRRISDEIVRRLDFSRQVIFDADAVAASNVRGCTLAAPADDVQIRSAGCSAKCFDSGAAIQATCEMRRPAVEAWVEPSGSGEEGVAYDALQRKRGDVDDRADVRFAIPCSTPPGRFNATVSFRWRAKTPWSSDGNGAFASKASVRDLFDSLADAIVRIAAPRRLRIGIDLAK
jgi:hypothetical protein